MKKRDFFIIITGAWFVIIMMLLSGCSITRKVNKDRTEVSTEKVVNESVKTVSDISTQTGEQVSSTTNIVENCDTVVTVQALPTGNPQLDEYLKSNPLKVPVKFNRTTNKQEYTSRQENKKENISVDQDKNSKENIQSVAEKKNVDQKTTPSIVFWGIGLIAFAGIAFLGYKFLKKRFL
jgi:hypothetical protein